MYLRFINNARRFVSNLTVGDGTPGTKFLYFANQFLSMLGANPTAIRTWMLPDRNGNIALLDDITNKINNASFKKLSSEYYTMGEDVAILPVVGGQSGITAYWGLQLGGIRAAKLFDTSYNLRNPPIISSLQTSDSFCIGIQAQTEDLVPFYPANLGSSGNFSILAIYATTWHTSGHYINCKRSNFTSAFSVNMNGEIAINNEKVLGARQPGWTVSSGTANRGAFDTATATLQQCSERVKALEDTLRTHGLID